MSVYKEAYHLISEIQDKASRIYPDACDYGTTFIPFDETYYQIKQLASDYGTNIEKTKMGCAIIKKCELNLINESDYTKELFELVVVKAKYEGKFIYFCTIDQIDK